MWAADKPIPEAHELRAELHHLEAELEAADEPVPAGEHQVRVEFAYDGNGRGKGGMATLFVNGAKVGSGRIERTHSNTFSLDDAADVGVDEGTPVSSTYKSHESKFTGKINKVTIIGSGPAGYTAAINSWARDNLKFRTDREYQAIGRSVRPWDWSTGGEVVVTVYPSLHAEQVVLFGWGPEQAQPREFHTDARSSPSRPAPTESVGPRVP